MVKTRQKPKTRRAKTSPAAAENPANGKIFLVASAVIYALAVIYSVWHGVSAPVRNWDMMGYVGAVIAAETDVPQEIHARMLAEIKPVVWPALYTEYAEKNRLSADAGNFYRQIPFYTIKPLYVAAVKLLNGLGAGLAASTWYVSTFSFIVMAAALTGWRPREANRGIWLLALSALMTLGYIPLGKFAGYSTPDPMSLMFFILAFVLWVRRKSPAGYTICNLLCVLTRPDALIQVVILTTYLVLFSAKDLRMKQSEAAITAGICCTGYLGVQLAMDAPGWVAIFYRGFINDNFDFTAAEAHLTVKQYFTAVFAGIGRELVNPRFILFVLLSVGALAEAWRRRATARLEWIWLLLAAWACFGARMALFPSTDERYFYGYYLLMIIASLELFAPFANELLAKKHPAAAATRKMLSWRT
jgi:hypothetical protein